MEQILNPNIQALRAYAAIIVVLFHASILVSVNGFSYGILKSATFNIEKWGDFGVDIFFIISGYIMFMINAKRKQSPLEFITDRIKRIVPVYWVLTILFTCLLLFVPFAFRNLNFSSEHFITSLLFISKYFNYESPVLYVGWTLEYEMFFYLAFAIVLFLRKNSPIQQIVLLTLIFLISIAFGTFTSIIFEFLYGGIIFIFFNKYSIINKFGNKLTKITNHAKKFF